jgi:hypothetical protein
LHIKCDIIYKDKNLFRPKAEVYMHYGLAIAYLVLGSVILGLVKQALRREGVLPKGNAFTGLVHILYMVLGAIVWGVMTVP